MLNELYMRQAADNKPITFRRYSHIAAHVSTGYSFGFNFELNSPYLFKLLFVIIFEGAQAFQVKKNVFHLLQLSESLQYFNLLLSKLFEQFYLYCVPAPVSVRLTPDIVGQRPLTVSVTFESPLLESYTEYHVSLIHVSNGSVFRKVHL